jgi:acyl carrier protein
MTGTDSKEVILQIITDYIDLPPEELTPERTLSDLGIDSVDFVEILYEIEQKYDVPLMDVMRGLDKTVTNFGDFIDIASKLVDDKAPAEGRGLGAVARPRP